MESPTSDYLFSFDKERTDFSATGAIEKADVFSVDDTDIAKLDINLSDQTPVQLNYHTVSRRAELKTYLEDLFNKD